MKNKLSILFNKANCFVKSFPKMVMVCFNKTSDFVKSFPKMVKVCFSKEKFVLLLYAVTIILFVIIPLYLSRIFNDIVISETYGIIINFIIGVCFLTYLFVKNHKPKIILLTLALAVSVSLLLFCVPFGAIAGGIFLESFSLVLLTILEFIGLRRRGNRYQ
jgi:hypothetical protein